MKKKIVKILLCCIAVLVIFGLYKSYMLFSGAVTEKERAAKQSTVSEKSRQEEKGSKTDELSESDIEELKWLVQTLHVSRDTSNTIGKGGVLDTKEKQADFLYALNEREYEHIFKSVLGKYVVFEDDKKLISPENAELILKMAGASVKTDVWKYMTEQSIYGMESEDVFALPMYARDGSDYFIEFRDWTFIVKEDGKLTVRYKTYIQALGGYIERVELRLHKNEQSTFAGYSADYMMAVPIEAEDETFANEKPCFGNNWGEYSPPLSMGDSIDDYIFRLDGYLYQMPFPLNELTSKGWEYDGKLKEDEEREEITLKKEGKELYCIVWNCQRTTEPMWYVVSLKTGFGEGISDVDFELFSGRKRGDYAYGYGVHGIYGFWDPLYLDFGISVDAGTGEDKTIKGFEITYAPKYIDRIKRLNEIATDVEEEVSITETGDTELERDTSYKLSIYDEPIYVQVKSLDKIGWGEEMDIIWVKKADKEEIMGYIEYGVDFTLCIDDNKKAIIKVLRMEDGPNDEPELFPIH